MTDLIKVSGTSVTTAVAGAIAGIIRQQGTVEVQAIGARAVNQAAKAVAIARVYLREDGIAIACVPALLDVDVAGQIRTALRFNVFVQTPPAAAPTLLDAPAPPTPANE